MGVAYESKYKQMAAPGSDFEKLQFASVVEQVVTAPVDILWHAWHVQKMLESTDFVGGADATCSGATTADARTSYMRAPWKLLKHIVPPAIFNVWKNVYDKVVPCLVANEQKRPPANTGARKGVGHTHQPLGQHGG